MDYHKLNAVSQADTYPMPCVDELLNYLGQVKYISTLDLKKVIGKFQWQRRIVARSPSQLVQVCFNST